MTGQPGLSGMIFRPLVIAIALLLCPFEAPRVSAQVAGATLTGTILDESGSAVANVKIAVKNTATGITTEATSNSDGLYTVPNLLPGTYDITASSPGFKNAVAAGITLTVGAEQVLKLVLEVGAVTENVEVTSAAPTVELTSSTISGEVNGERIVELPLNGRSWTDLATLEPGVDSIPDQPAVSSHDRAARGFGQDLTISGQRPQQNNYRLDGISINDLHNAAPGSILAGNLGVDAIAEFSVLTSNYSAEYGKTSGGVINAITKSGTNNFHGDA
jgi:hypothetical protein